ncbi:MAG: YaiI/YqxD family protein [Alphaproteobacteria bacterium]|nr:YaiI/YqxD family protein [Alphaproteobacteria bacterium]
MLDLYVDADACPVKPEIYRVAERYGLNVFVVANDWMRVPDDPRIRLITVADGLDVADDWIAERAGQGDIAITSDIPLAARCIKNGARALSSSGQPFTEDSIGDVLATRNLMTELRETGEISTTGRPFGKQDRSRFLQSLDAAIQAIKRTGR